MIHESVNGISLHKFESFKEEQVGHAFFSRKGGVSPAPWASLNHGGTVGDARENVVENRKRAFGAVNRPVESIYDVWQVHGTEVICTDSPRALNADHVKADAIFTDNSEVTLFMRFADCVPILIHDPVKNVVGIIHAGWQGTVKKIVSRAIQVMVERYESEPATVIVGIGPSIGQCHYQVGEEVVEAVKGAFGNDATDLIAYKNGKPYFDLWKTNRLLLVESGVRMIETAGICTACNTDEWYSHRAEHGKTGRFAAAIFLHEGKKDGG